MSARLIAVVLSLAALGFGCDSGSDSESSSGPLSSTAPPAEQGEPVPGPVPSVPDAIPDVSVDEFSPEVVEMCRGAYGRLPPDEQGATAEDAFIAQCLAAVSGRPDPLQGGLL